MMEVEVKPNLVLEHTLGTSGEDKLWSCDWTPFPFYQDANSKTVLASCGDRGMYIWSKLLAPPPPDAPLGYNGFVKHTTFDGAFRTCKWHLTESLIAGGYQSKASVGIWKYTYNEWKHSEIKINDMGEVTSLSWDKNKLLFCTRDGSIIIARFEESGEFKIFLTREAQFSGTLTAVKWFAADPSYFVTGGYTGIEVYRVSKHAEAPWTAEMVARTDDKSRAVDICLNPTFEGYHREVLMLRQQGDIRTYILTSSKDYKGNEIVELEFENEHHGISYKAGNSSPLKHMVLGADWNKGTIGKHCRFYNFIAVCRGDRRISLYSNNAVSGHARVHQYHHVAETKAHTKIWKPTDHELLASASLDGTVKIWRLKYVDEPLL